LGGGISVIDAECARRATESGVCSHIDIYYRSAVKRPPFLYWVFNTTLLEEHFGKDDFHLVNTPTESGDDCHIDIKGISNNRAKKFAKKYCGPPGLYLCLDHGSVKLTKDQYEHLKETIASMAGP
jgi:hypothetical protein